MKLINKIKKAEWNKKNELWENANMNMDEIKNLINDMILSLPKGYYKLHERTYGTNLIDLVWEIYGKYPSFSVSESTLLGLQALYPDRIYASFTLGLDAIQIK